MDLKCPTSFQEQISLLRQHGVCIHDEQQAFDILQQINYYRLTGYALQFRKSENDSDYVAGITFDEIIRVYQFDQDLRSLLRQYLEIVEVYLKTQIAHEFSIIKCIKPPHDQHYDEANYYNKRGFSEVIDSFTKEKSFYRDSLIFQHHNKNYNGRMPLWAMVELLSFSNVSKLYSSMYDSDKDIISAKIGISRKTMVNHMHCLSVLRNRCAHCARLYNTVFNPPARFNSNFLRKHPNVIQNTLFAYILILVKRLPDIEHKKDFVSNFNTLLSDYQDIDLSLTGIPSNYSEILLQLSK